MVPTVFSFLRTLIKDFMRLEHIFWHFFTGSIYWSWGKNYPRRLNCNKACNAKALTVSQFLKNLDRIALGMELDNAVKTKHFFAFFPFTPIRTFVLVKISDENFCTKRTKVRCHAWALARKERGSITKHHIPIVPFKCTSPLWTSAGPKAPH